MSNLVAGVLHGDEVYISLPKSTTIWLLRTLFRNKQPYIPYNAITMSAWCDECDEPMISNGDYERFECPNCKCWISWDAWYEYKASMRSGW